LTVTLLQFICALPVLAEEADAASSSPTPAYAVREQRLAAYKEELKDHECQEINLDFCARLLYAIDESGTFANANAAYPENGLLSNFLTREMIYAFGKTGEWLDVIYFKDENSNPTDEPALLYFGVSDYNVGIEQVQEAIDLWEEDAPGFLRAMYANDVVVFFQNKSDSYPGANAKYGNGVIYFNCGQIDKDVAGSGNFVKTIMIHMGVEQFGNRMCELVGDEYRYSSNSGPIKEILAYECCEYLYKLTGEKFYSDRVESYKTAAAQYIIMYGNG